MCKLFLIILALSPVFMANAYEMRPNPRALTKQEREARNLDREQVFARSHGLIARSEAFSFIKSLDKSVDLEHRELKGLFGRKFGERLREQYKAFYPENKFLSFDHYYAQGETPLDKDQYVIYRYGAKKTCKDENEASRLFADAVSVIEEKFGRKIELSRVSGNDVTDSNPKMLFVPKSVKKGLLVFDSGKASIGVCRYDYEWNFEVEIYAESVEIREAIIKKKRELSVKAEEEKQRAVEKQRNDVKKASLDAL